MAISAFKLVYHRLYKPRWINVIICEPAPGEYVWMSMYLRPELRNGRISREIVHYILHLLPGNHHIHFFPEIHTLRRLAREDGWQYEGKSSWYAGCLAFYTRSLRHQPAMAPLLDSMVTHQESHRRPWLPTFKDPPSAKRALRRIAKYFGPQSARQNGQPGRRCKVVRRCG